MRGLRRGITNSKSVKILADAIAVTLSFVFALAIRFDFAIPSQYITNLLPFIPAIALLYLLDNYITRIYSRRWKYASFDEFLGLIGATTLSTVILLTAVLLIPGGRRNLPVSVVVIGGMISLFSMAFIRLQFRLFSDRRLRSGAQGGTKALLIGAGEAGEMVARDMLRHPEYNYNPIGFIDDDPKKSKLVVQGVPVLGGREEIPTAATNHEIDEIIITMPSATGEKIREILPFCEKTSAKIKIIPGIFLAMADEPGVASVRELRLEDLLGRAPCEIDLESISAYITGKVVLVTGAGGSIGSEISRQLSGLGPRRLLLLDRDETSLHYLELELESRGARCPADVVVADIRDADRIESVFKRYEPQIIFHSAALKHVPMLESHPSEAVKNNVMGTRNMAQLGVKHGVERFILISTDKAVNPVNVMGATKRVSEFIIEGLLSNNGTLFSAVRFGNVLGSRGSVVPIFKKQIEEGGPVLVTHPEATRYFMTIKEAAQLVIQAGAYTENGDVFLLDMGDPIRIIDLAKEMISLLGNGRNIDIRVKGLRPGEKLHEQLVFQAEDILPTPHPKINRVINGLELPQDFDAQVDALIEAARRDDENEIKALLSCLMPCYQPFDVNKEEVTEEAGEKKPGLRLFRETGAR